MPGAATRTGRRSRSGRGRAGSIRGAEAMRDAPRRRCGPGKGAGRTGRRRTVRSGPRGARRARRSGAHAAKPQPAEASRPGRCARQAGCDAQRSKHRTPGLRSRMPGAQRAGDARRLGPSRQVAESSGRFPPWRGPHPATARAAGLEGVRAGVLERRRGDGAVDLDRGGPFERERQPPGLEYRIVTSPVAESFDSEKSHATCSLAAERLDLFLYGLSWACAACVAFWNSRA